jgi:predicted phage terminase large subunit-like protein
MMSRSEYRSFLKRDFVSFTQRVFYTLNPDATFQPNWHHEVIAAKLEDCRRGITKRLVISLPPRQLKSIFASIAFPAWLLGHDPTTQIICASYGQDLAETFSRATRMVLSAPWYQQIFATRLSPDKQTAQEFYTTRNGFRFATSVGGPLTGRGGDFLIVDDALKPEEALSETTRNNCNSWFDSTLLSRLNDKTKGCIIVIMQRLHQDDLIGHLVEQGGWEAVAFPAIAEHDEEFIVDNAFGTVRVGRKAGEALHPAREPEAVLARIRAAIGEYNFAGQYQQNPAPLGGGLVKESWFRRYRPEDIPRSFETIVQSWDTANKADQLNNFSVCTTWGIVENKFYLLNIFRRRLEYPDLKRAVREQALRYSANTILIEDKASGTQLIQELARENLRGISAYKPEGDKVMRMNAQTAAIEGGFVYIPETAPWLAEYLLELTTFPRAKYNDQADSTSQFLAWTLRRGEGLGLLEYYRRLAEPLEANSNEQATTIRLVPPDPITHLYTTTGRSIMVDHEGTVQVTAEEAKPLFAHGYKLFQVA